MASRRASQSNRRLSLLPFSRGERRVAGTPAHRRALFERPIGTRNDDKEILESWAIPDIRARRDR
jgi:hypothetical protein